MWTDASLSLYLKALLDSPSSNFVPSLTLHYCFPSFLCFLPLSCHMVEQKFHCQCCHKWSGLPAREVMDHKTLCQRPMLPPSHMPACSAPAYKSNLSNRLLSARTGASYVVMCHCINECAGPTQKHHFFSFFSLGPIVTVATTESMQQKQPTQQLSSRRA